MMDMEDMDRILRQLAEQDPELFRSWIDSNYCVSCPHFYGESEEIAVVL